MVKWLWVNRNKGCSRNSLFRANSLEMVQWLVENRIGGSLSGVASSAARREQFELAWFVAPRISGDVAQHVAYQALMNHHLEVFQMVREHHPGSLSESWIKGNEGCSKDAVFMAVRFGHLEVLKCSLQLRTDTLRSPSGCTRGIPTSGRLVCTGCIWTRHASSPLPHGNSVDSVLLGD